MGNLGGKGIKMSSVTGWDWGMDVLAMFFWFVLIPRAVKSVGWARSL